VLRGTSERTSGHGAGLLTIAIAISLIAPAGALADAPSVAIVSGPPTWTNHRSATFGLSSDEPEAIECRLDAHVHPGAHWDPCEDGHTIAGPLQEGRHVLEARAAGEAGAEAQDRWTWRVDVTAPSVPTVFEPVGRWHLERYVSSSWGATDSYSGVHAYDVRYDVWAASGSASADLRWLEDSTVTGAAFPARTGRTYCLRVGVEDRAGNPGPGTSPPRCFARPLDDGALERRGRWKQQKADGYLGAGYVETTQAGAFARTTLFAKRLLLVATRCPRCGSVEVRWRGQIVRTVDLSAAKTTKSARIPLVSLPALERGTVRVDVISTNLRVRIDGVGASAV
jgi:hypothetical protein